MKRRGLTQDGKILCRKWSAKEGGNASAQGGANDQGGREDVLDSSHKKSRSLYSGKGR